MTIEVDRFPDGRKKVIRKHKTTDSNVRVEGKEITIVSKIDEVKLEDEVIEACNRDDLLRRIPQLKESVDKVMDDFFKNSRRQ